MTPATIYRVVGVRQDGSQRVLADGLTLLLAEQIRAQVSDAFHSVIVEADPTAGLFPENVQPQDKARRGDSG